MSTTVWLHHLQSKEMVQEKAKWGLQNMLPAVFNKSWKTHPSSCSYTATYLPSQKPSKINHIHQLCAITGCLPVDIRSALAERHRWQERKSKESMLLAHLVDQWWWFCDSFDIKGNELSEAKSELRQIYCNFLKI